MPETPENSRTRLLTATIDLVRANGYAATRVEDVCAAAGAATISEDVSSTENEASLRSCMPAPSSSARLA